MDAHGKAEQALLTALKTDNPDVDEYPEAYLRWVAAGLAAALEEQAASGAGFANHVRQVCFNLPKPHNHPRRRALCNRTLAPSAIGNLSAESWTSRERQAERLADSVKRRKMVTIQPDASAVRTRAVTCGACGARDAMAQSIGDQRESRKAETWGSKDHEEASHRARLQCNVCANVWHADDAPLFYDEVVEEEDEEDPAAGAVGWEMEEAGDTAVATATSHEKGITSAAPTASAEQLSGGKYIYICIEI